MDADISQLNPGPNNCDRGAVVRKKILVDTVINELRECEEFCDITIIAKNERFPAHKVVLAGCSPYFRAMFLGGFAEAKQSEVTVHQDIDSDTMKTVLDLAYTGEIILSFDNIDKLLHASSVLQERRAWWTNLQRKLCVKIPEHLVNILLICGYDNAITVSELTPARFDAVEQYARQELPKLINLATDAERYYGIYENNREEFKIADGHKILLLKIAGAYKTKNPNGYIYANSFLDGLS